jgi:uncharacterized RDD family membrane protein YckC
MSHNSRRPADEPASTSANEPPYASWPRRIAALAVDWVACTLVSIVVLGGLTAYSNDPAASWIVLGVYLFEATLGTALAGGSFGQLVVGIRVWRTDGRSLSLLAALVRTILICLVVPPLVFKPETGRGLHDLATHSAAYRFSRR